MDFNYENEIVLKQAISNGIINIDDLCKQLSLMNRKNILNEVHKGKIWTGYSTSKGRNYQYWYTYLPDKQYKNNNRLIKRASREKLEDAIVDFYNGKVTVKKENNKIFKTVFKKWVEFKKQLVSDNTIYRYNNDYNRFFKNTDFENTSVCDINE